MVDGKGWAYTCTWKKLIIKWTGECAYQGETVMYNAIVKESITGTIIADKQVTASAEPKAFQINHSGISLKDDRVYQLIIVAKNGRGILTTTAGNIRQYSITYDFYKESEQLNYMNHYWKGYALAGSLKTIPLDFEYFQSNNEELNIYRFNECTAEIPGDLQFEKIQGAGTVSVKFTMPDSFTSLKCNLIRTIVCDESHRAL